MTEEEKVEIYSVVLCKYSHCNKTWWEDRECEGNSYCRICNEEIEPSTVQYVSMKMPVFNF